MHSLNTSKLSAFGSDGRVGPGGYRLMALWLCFAVWGLLLFSRFSQIMVWQRSDYLLDLSFEEGWRYEMIPAARGRLLDVSGRPLAWTSRVLALDWRVPAAPEQAEREWRLLDSVVAIDDHWRRDRALARPDTRIRLKRELEPAEFAGLQDLLVNLESLRITSYFVRERIDHSFLRERIGEVQFEQASEIGRSGWEKEHDGLLRGVPALLRVRLDQENRPIPGTREVIREMRSGYDVYLPFRLDP